MLKLTHYTVYEFMYRISRVHGNLYYFTASCLTKADKNSILIRYIRFSRDMEHQFYVQRVITIVTNRHMLTISKRNYIETDTDQTVLLA